MGGEAMIENPQAMIDEVEGYRLCLLQHLDGDGFWSCSIYTQRDGDEQMFYGTGASIYFAIRDAVNRAKEALSE